LNVEALPEIQERNRQRIRDLENNLARLRKQMSQLPCPTSIEHQPRKENNVMNEDATQSTQDNDIPASLRRQKKEPQKALMVRIALSHWEELAAFGLDYEQDVSTFVREAIEDWLRRARKARNTQDTEGA
jgi:hypothetical protein